MIVRITRMQECWCPNCAAGQMEKLHDIIFRERIPESQLIGRTIKCDRCGADNVIEDVVDIIPTSFLISSKNEMSKVKSNQELFNWLNKE